MKLRRTFIQREDSFRYEENHQMDFEQHDTAHLLLESSVGWHWLLCNLLAIWFHCGWWFALVRSLRDGLSNSFEIRGEKGWEFSVTC